MRGRAYAARLGLALALAGGVSAPTLARAEQPAASDATPEQLAAARKAFTDALEDEKRKDFAAALEKLRKVRAVRDTIPVRYRVAACLEGMGKLASARAAYQETAKPTAYPSPDDAEIAKTAAERATALEPRIPRLALELPKDAPSGVLAKVDGQPASTTEPNLLDAGDHEVTAEAPGHRPFASKVSLSDGAKVSLRVALDREGAPPPPPPPPTEDKNYLPAYIAFGGSALLLAGAGVSLAVRASAISTVKDDCPGDVCPTSKKTEVDSARDRAKLMLPLAIGLGAAGVAAAGVGVYFVLAPPAKKAEGLRAVRLAGAPLGEGGAIFSLDSRF